MIEIFTEVGIVIIVATLLAFLGRYLRQPSIVAYMVAGLIIGPAGFRIIENSEIIALFSELGIIFLLFIVGLHLDYRRLRDVGISSILIGLGQIVFTASVGYFIARIWFPHLTAMYIAIALTLSSTVVIVKLFMDMNQLTTLVGRIALGVLLVQDIVAIFAILFFSKLGSITPSVFILVSAEIIFFFGVTALAALYAVPRLIESVAKSRELLLLTTLSWAFIVSLSAHYFGFSTVIGAFIAGITLASTPYALEISGRIKPLRDFFVPVFFVALGMQIIPSALKLHAAPVIAFSLFVLLGNPLIMIFITSMYGYHKRTGFLTSISLAQISEFSLVLVTLGFSLGHVSADIVALIATIATVTITMSTYLIVHGQSLYRIVQPYMFWGNGKEDDLSYQPDKKADVILCGYNRMGYAILKKLHLLEKNVFVIDYNPDVIKALIEKKVPCVYGDITDAEVIDGEKFKRAKLIISTVQNMEDNLVLLKEIQKLNKKVRVVVSGHTLDEAIELYRHNADYVILPNYLSGDHVALLIEGFRIDWLKAYGKLHKKELKKRKELGHGRILGKA